MQYSSLNMFGKGNIKQMKNRLDMNGTSFMIKKLLVLLLLSSCGNLPIAYIQNFSSVNSVIFGFSDTAITQEIFDAEEIAHAETELNQRVQSLETGARSKLLEQYANPVIRQIQST